MNLANETLPDELNPDYMFQTIPTDLLVQVAQGKIDLNKLANEELAARGFDKHGEFVGFKKAKAGLVK